MIILFFGQPGSGKTTLADALQKELFDDAAAIRIDGDKWRDITKNIDYSKMGRLLNLKNAFNMALYLEQEKYVPILSFVTPYEAARKHLRTASSNLVEIFLEYDVDRGRNSRFVNDFEPPVFKCLKINTSSEAITASVDKVVDYVLKNGKIL